MEMATYPLVSVILPAYNAENTIAESIQSIINQTYTNWELIVINDGSADGTETVIKSFSDNRLKYYSNDGNKKLIYTLNRGIDLANGKYIARIDSDDIAEPCRFEKQVEYLEKNPGTIVCGSFMKTFGKGVKSSIVEYHLSDKEIKENFLIHTSFGHPSVMIRKSVLLQTGIRYDEGYPCAEDLKLWLDLMPYGQYANIPLPLMNYRISDFQCTQKGNKAMIESTQKCKRLYFRQTVSEDVWEVFKEKGVNPRLLRKIEYSANKIGLYEAMRTVDVFTLVSFFISGDCFRVTSKDRKYIINRFLGRTFPVM